MSLKNKQKGQHFVSLAMHMHFLNFKNINPFEFIIFFIFIYFLENTSFSNVFIFSLSNPIIFSKVHSCLLRLIRFNDGISRKTPIDIFDRQVGWKCASAFSIVVYNGCRINTLFKWKNTFSTKKVKFNGSFAEFYPNC